MRKSLGSLALIAIFIAAIGFYRGWFRVSTESQPHTTNVDLTIDRQKILEDAEKAKELGASIGDRIGEPSESDENEEQAETSE